MLRKRVIPCLDVADGRVVKGVNFLNLRDEGSPVELAGFYAAEGADEICLLDITASHRNQPTMLKIVNQVAANVFVPLTVGGGIRSVEDMRACLRAGADKVSLNTAALARPELIEECAEAFGSQAVVLAIDAYREDEAWKVRSVGGRNETGHDPIDWAVSGVKQGAGEILLTSIDRDGTKHGYDLELLEAMRQAVPVPLIASGGAGTVGDCVAALQWADAVLAASIFHRREVSIGDLKAGLAAAGIAVRR